MAPAPISTPTSRAPLRDSEQTKAFHAGRPVALRRSTTTRICWTATRPPPSSASRRPAGTSTGANRKLAEHVVLVPAGNGGTEHWPCRVIREFKAGPAAAPAAAT
ncbi:hypothetical protein J7E88_28525 [Streptomyces sp. ISL-10]|uniref:hypothetical protein n=1 Tax=Streptomyces sp. ISL-10 TaxID=2819172 RepID=UPI001BE9A10E|nr:hypothetical protein [Streptomyces sp. ISL-10]MBT2369155.1 hypothetical protein [Streptomyces sp. ISL-10]